MIFAYDSVGKFNGLNNFPKDEYSCFGPAPPSLNDLLSKFGKEYTILSSDKAIESEKKFYYLLETQGPPETWLGTKKNYNNTLLSGVSENIIQATMRGQCKIILWSCNEGYDPFQYKIFEKIYQELEYYMLPPENFIYVSGNLLIDTLHYVWGKQENVGSIIKCIPFNNEFYDKYDKIQSNVIFDGESKNRDKYFLLLNRAPRIHRMALISWLHSKNLLENTLTSFPSEKLAPYNFSKDNHLESYFANMLYVGRNKRTEIFSAWEDLKENHFPLIVDVEEWKTNHYGTSSDWLYNRTFFSVVTESIFDDVSIFLDEKIWKPIYNYHPFLILGTPNCLKKLREYGFKTFEPFIDESYDVEYHHGKRMKMIVEEVSRLSNMKLDELKVWYKNMIPILKHNRDLLLNDKSLFDNLLKELTL